MNVMENMFGPVAVVTPLNPRLDAASCAAFRDRLEQVLDRGHELVVVDLSAVEFMDSTGLSAILRALRALAGRGRLACAGVRAGVRKLLEVTKLDQGLLDIHPDAETAARALAQGREARP
ncbi:Anti-sigma-B factor antagonist [Fundidesulfovibrio magnetotacticus]|uniref:Anti-sigma-B factor antagonist n=1 Tax=Fundidesulfovibrio magnetotacticus TaxID=2730080 RepID=A0A6V8LNF7_9BACT|nr:STAS domain-containing protein [Fundidesulfovibrio magnetotacticus]GFK94153.1 Anti-sigma-B factor antagonist [Fundidesulfovibrio magnetotacticus]